MNSKVYKWCAVPQCKNTSIKTPDKLFVNVPNEKTMRIKWLKLARRDPFAISLNSSIYFCEDHFDLQNDMIENIHYHVMGSVLQIRLKLGCIPTRFECQLDRRKRTSITVARAYILKKPRQRTRKVVSTVKSSISSSDVKQELDDSTDFDQQECNEMDTNMIQAIKRREMDQKDKFLAKNDWPSTDFQLENHSTAEVHVKLELDDTTPIKSERIDNGDQFALVGDVKVESDFGQSDILLGNIVIENKPKTASCSSLIDDIIADFDSETSDSEDRKSFIEQLIGEDGLVQRDKEMLS